MESSALSWIEEELQSLNESDLFRQRRVIENVPQAASRSMEKNISISRQMIISV